MCGIAGIYAFDERAPEPDVGELVRIRDRMRLRGPDGAGLWQSAHHRLVLGHRRLSIIDLDARADQPLLSHDERFVLVFNGEIYNYAWLRASLEKSGAQFRTQSDSEVIIELVRRDGPKAMTQLRGMFAIALFDQQAQSLLLARDPYGIKPLYVSEQNGTLRFASSVKALVSGGAISAAIKPAAEVGLLLFGHVPEPHCWIEAIKPLPAGTWRLYQNATVREENFASLRDAFLHEASPVELSQYVREVLSDSVRHHLVADVPVGAFLSAGVDSGALLGLMSEQNQTPICSTTLRFAEFAQTPADESPLAEVVANRYGADHLSVTITQQDFERDIDHFFAEQDQPTLDGINTWFVSKVSAGRGLKVCVSGVGGDELFAGYPSFRQLPKARAWLHWPAKIPLLGQVVRHFLAAFDGRFGIKAKSAGLLELGGTWAGLYLLRRGVFMPWQLAHYISADRLAEGLRQLSWQALLQRECHPQLTDLGQVGLLEASCYMRNQLLRDTDWASMAHSLEIRTPLVDYTLLAQLAPYQAMFASGLGKQLTAQAPKLALPAAIVDRPKTGFTTPIAAWMQRQAQVARQCARPELARAHWSRAYTLAVGEMAGARWRAGA